MLVKLTDNDWSDAVPVDGPAMVQARTDGVIFVAWSQDGSTPDGPTEGLRLRDGDRELLGFVTSQQLRFRRGDGTAFAEIFIGQWSFTG